MMKKGVIIVNTARGAIIDEAALVRALDCGQVASVGLDVYEDEPKIHPGLIANPRVVLLPHMGTWTAEVSLLILLVTRFFKPYGAEMKWHRMLVEAAAHGRPSLQPHVGHECC
jgi:hypothetical protein